MEVQPAHPMKIFFCYAPEDDALREQLVRHLSPLKHLRHITSWLDRDIQAGTEWEREREKQFDTANIILLLISADFIASDYCYRVEMMKALERQKAGSAQVIPILLRPVEWEKTSLGKLSPLPTNRVPVTHWPNPDDAWLNIVQGISDIVSKQHLAPNAGAPPPSDQGKGDIVKNIPFSQAVPRQVPDSHPKDLVDHNDVHDRKMFLDWIGIYYAERLKEAFEGAVPIIPDFSLESFYQNTSAFSNENQRNHIQPAGTTIIQIYDKKETRGDLLILGKPGAGKTTILLTLATALHARTEPRFLSPMPVIVSLSTWTKRIRSFKEWFIKETSRRYNMPLKLIQRWFETGQLLPLLDGLDEVPSSTYDVCVKAIHDFRHESPSFIPLVICSRYEEDLKQLQSLPVQSAVIILPLKEQQIQEYCKAAEIDKVLQNNEELRELAKIPFMLHILVLIYRNVSFQYALPKGALEKLQQELFDRYLQKMLESQQRGSSWPLIQTKDWLAWIAWHLQENNKSDFTLEDLTPAWLPKTQRLFYELITKLISLPIAMLLVQLVFKQVQNGLSWLNSSNVCSGLSCFQQEDAVGAFFTNVGTVIIGWLSNGIVATVLGVICVLGVVNLIDSDKITVDFTLSWKRWLWTFQKPFQKAWQSLLHWDIDYLQYNMKDIVDLISPLAFLAWILGLAFAVSLAWHIVIDLLLMLLLLIIYMMGLFFFSFILRFLLWRSGCLPWNIGSFLDESVHHLLLYKENNRYRFIHNLFRDYLASIEKQSVKNRAHKYGLNSAINHKISKTSK